MENFWETENLNDTPLRMVIRNTDLFSRLLFTPARPNLQSHIEIDRTVRHTHRLSFHSAAETSPSLTSLHHYTSPPPSLTCSTHPPSRFSLGFPPAHVSCPQMQISLLQAARAWRRPVRLYPLRSSREGSPRAPRRVRGFSHHMCAQKKRRKVLRDGPDQLHVEPTARACRIIYIHIYIHIDG